MENMPDTLLRSRQFGKHNRVIATDHLTARSNANVGRDLRVKRKLIIQEGNARSSQFYQEDDSLELKTQQLNISSDLLEGIRSKGLTGSQGLTVGHTVRKDMRVGGGEESLDEEAAPNNIPIDGNEITCTHWDDWGNDVFDDWGHFYIFDVETNEYFFPLFDDLNLPDGEFATQSFDVLDRTYTITHGWCAQGIYKFDVACSSPDSLFIFGAYGDMGSDDDTINTNLTQEYELDGSLYTLYYNRNIEEGDEIERFFSYFIPYEKELNSSKTYSDFLTNDDQLSLYSVPVRYGITVYFSKKSDVKDWVINDLNIEDKRVNNSHLNVYGTINAERYYLNGAYLIPPGTIVSFISNRIPSGWLACDGSAYLRADYPALFYTISTTFGGDDEAQTFNVPDMRSRVVVGASQGPQGPQGLSNMQLADTGGEETHLLTEAEIPAHTHTGTTSTNGAHTHSSNANGGNDGIGLVQDTNSNTAINVDNSFNEHNVYQQPVALSINSDGSHDHTFTTDSTGTGNSHNNMQPYIVLTYIISTGPRGPTPPFLD